MKNSLIILCFFALGVFAGLCMKLPSFFMKSDLSMITLYTLIFFVGVGIGGDSQVFSVLKGINVKILLIPLSVMIGSILGPGILSFFMEDMALKDLMAIGSGFGYYSLSSIYITELRGETLGTIALLSNIMREIFTLLAAPLLVKYAGGIAPIASGGATTMDTTLPVITLYSGRDYAIIALFSGVVLTIAVPFLVPFILTF